MLERNHDLRLGNSAVITGSGNEFMGPFAIGSGTCSGSKVRSVATGTKSVREFTPGRAGDREVGSRDAWWVGGSELIGVSVLMMRQAGRA